MFIEQNVLPSPPTDDVAIIMCTPSLWERYWTLVRMVLNASEISDLGLLNNNKLLISKPLKHFTGLLEDNNSFYRTHRSFLINLKYIKQLVKKDGTHILMDNDAVIAVSKERQSDLIELLNKMF